MKQNYYLSVVKSQTMRLLMLLTVVLCASTVKAADETTFTPVEVDKDYTMVPGANNYEFVAPESGTVTIKSTGTDVPRPHLDKELKNEVANTFSRLADGSVQTVFTATKGTTYYLACFTFSKSTSFRITMGAGSVKLELNQVNPEEGSSFDITSTSGTAVFSFSTPVDIDGAALVYSSGRKDVSYNVSSNMVTVSLKNEVYELVQSGTLKAGDSFSVELTGVHSSMDNTIIYGTDGTAKVSYLAPGSPMALKSESVPKEFKTFWDKGDASGLIKLEFTKELFSGENGPKAVLTFGNVEGEGELYREDLPVTISGSTLTVDLTNKMRTYKDMLPGVEDGKYNMVNIKISNVKDKDGNLAYTGSASQLGSFSYSLQFQNNAKDVSWEFTPKAGASLANTSSLELYLVNGDVVSYDGVKFDYTTEGKRKSTVVGNDQIEKETDPDASDAQIINIPVPAEAKTGTNVKVSLNNVKFLDGVTRDISAVFNRMKLTLVNPKNTTLEKFANGDSLVVTTNMSDNIGYMTYQVRDLNPEDPNDAIVKTFTQMRKAEDPTTKETYFVREFTADYKLMQGHTYAAEFTAYRSEEDDNYNAEPIDTAQVLFFGLTKGYEYSPYKLTKITPEPGSVLETENDGVFNLTFDGLVSLVDSTTFINKGMGMIQPFESITPKDEGATRFSKTWELKISPEFLASVPGKVDISIVACDEQGRRVKGNLGTDETTHFYYSYDTNTGGKDFSSEPSDSATTDRIAAVNCDYADGIGMSYEMRDDAAVMYDKDGKEVAKVKEAELYIPEEEMDNWDYIPTRIILHLDKEVTEKGDYTFEVPARYFLLGQQFSAEPNKKTTLHFTIDGAVHELVKTFEPDSVSPVQAPEIAGEKLSEFTLTYYREAGINTQVTTPVTVMSLEGRTQVATATPSVDKNNPNKIVFTLDKEISTAGNYRVDIPEGLIGDTLYINSGYKLGHCNSAESLSFTLAKLIDVNKITADPANGSMVTELKRIVLTFDEADNVAPSYDPSFVIELRNDKGEKVADATSDTDWNIPEYNKIPVDLAEAFSTLGTYTLHIPAGFYNINDGTQVNKDIDLTYTITTAEGITGVVAADNGVYKVFTVGGAKVMTTTDKAQLKKLTSGLYIINGKKVVIK